MFNIYSIIVCINYKYLFENSGMPIDEQSSCYVHSKFKKPSKCGKKIAKKSHNKYSINRNRVAQRKKLSYSP